MKLIIFIIAVCTAYFFGMRALIKELKAHPSQEERQKNQSFPMMIAASVLFLVVVVHTTKLAYMGVLPLL